MKISNNRPAGSSTSTGRTGSAKGGAAAGAFEQLLSQSIGSAAAASPASASAPIASLDGMLALQGITEEEGRRRQAVKEGSDMLDSLEKLRTSLLMGTIPPEVLRELDGRLARQRTQTSDPRLLEIIDDIELRVAVEKAKLDMAIARNTSDSY